MRNWAYENTTFVITTFSQQLQISRTLIQIISDHEDKFNLFINNSWTRIKFIQFIVESLFIAFIVR